MTDALSIAANIVGVVAPALQGTKFLLEELQNIKDAPETVRRLDNDVRSVDLALTSLRAVEDQEWKSLGANVAEESKTTITTCTRACNSFRTDLQRWTRHSEDGKLAWQDRANVGFLKQGRIKSMSKQLQNCKIIINSVVGIATLYSSIRHTHITEDIKCKISTRQIEVRGALDATDTQLVELSNRVQELNINAEDLEDADCSKAEALRQLEEERKALNSSRKLLNELLSKSKEEAIANAAAENKSRSTTITFGNQNLGFQAGIINGHISGLSFGGK